MASRYMLCSFKTCPWVQRAAIVLQAKQVPYDITYIDRDNRPAWFLAVSPHAKVPVLQIDGKEALFESNAIAEYLEETAEPPLHPQDAIARARNRAWTDYVPTFASAISNAMYSDSEEEFTSRAAKLAGPIGKLDEALTKRGNDGPYFNGRNSRWWMQPTRPSCSAIPSWTGCARWESSRNSRNSPRGAMRS